MPLSNGKWSMLEMSETRSLTQNGFAIVPRILDQGKCRELIDHLGPIDGAGRRALLKTPKVAELASSNLLLGLVRPHLRFEPRPVRGIYFDKSTDANWLVSWHQDLTISVRKRVNLPGFGPWSTKGGVPHVQPPIELLKQMIAVRLHLDDCDETNGALRVIPGSHLFGLLSHAHISELTEHSNAVACRLSAGDALLMSPLLLHASGRSKNPGHRRVLHIEYAGFCLPPELRWSEAD